MAEQRTLKPQFFLTRPNGAMVPLVAMDEMPFHVQIRGVPRSLTAFDIGGMTPLGLVESRHEYHVVEAMNNMNNIAHRNPTTGQKPSDLPSSLVSQHLGVALCPSPVVKFPGSITQPSDTTSSSFSTEDGKTNTPAGSSVDSSADTNTAPCPVPAWRQHATTNVAAPATTKIEDSKSTANAATASNTAKALTGKKVYCSYWLRKGECDFAQQGCIYKHEMPTDLETLQSVGFTDIPLWYRQRYDLGSLHVENGRNIPSFGVADRANPTPPRSFHVGDNAKRMIRNQIGPNNRSHSLRGWRQNGRRHEERRAPLEVGDKRQKQTEAAIDAVIAAEAEREREREALRKKFPCLAPESRSVFVGHEDLLTETFSNGEEPNDVHAQIRKIEQAAWEEEQAERQKKLAELEEKEKQRDEQTAAGETKKGPGKKKGGKGGKK
ncbi:hypothetical protein PV08_10750 [Exophiala spinifera]|uniref:C3H1-type domain-containing protein n=1 Tax=Exophiala spinifera TaxID=91928 RepID=A0A0D2AYI3_9EURO|nr:uncharacterized protein PV08_10750 [Exophiala spinifera]KIW11450.1 hypothetical protein PV08_10750 [Exophiala spinifera]